MQTVGISDTDHPILSVIGSQLDVTQIASISVKNGVATVGYRSQGPTAPPQLIAVAGPEATALLAFCNAVQAMTISIS
jgi:hypothetical protein